MEVIFGLEKEITGKKSVLTVGTFDGIHLGHREIINELLNIARERDLVSSLLTFEPHPKTVVQESPHRIKLLTTLEEKLEILHEIGLERFIIAKVSR